VVNYSPIKQFAENRHAVGQSVLESFLRITNRATNGRNVLVFGYGSVGKGIAASFRNAFARVSVVELDPVLRLEASFDGFEVPDRAAGLRTADVVITATGAEGIVTEADLDLLRDRVVLLNAGHFPAEIAVERITADPLVAQRQDGPDGITTLTLTDGRAIHLLAGGHMVNLGGPRPLGNSIESMDLGFALQARCLEAVATGRSGADDVVVPVPSSINALVAEAFLDLYR
jgi:adenosylhomocysteinase